METKKPEITYWKALCSDQEDTLKKIKGVTFVLHNSIEFIDIIDFLNTLQQGHLKDILYISLTRSYDYMHHALEIFPLTNKRIFFIDCVSGFAFPEKDTIDECLYHKPPNNIKTMKEIITFGIEKSNPDIVVVDSQSQFINYSKSTIQDLDNLYDFLNQIRKTMLNIITDTFILLFDTKIYNISYLPKNSADNILRIEKIESEKSNRIAFSTIPLYPA